MSKKEEVQIFVDVFEENSAIIDEIRSRGFEPIQKSLKSGDVAIVFKGKNVGIELKRVQDFSNSTKEGRFKDQICRLYDNFDFPVLIVEDWSPWVGDNDDENTIADKMRKHKKACKTLNRRICFEETDSQQETVDIIEDIVRDLKNGKLFNMKRPVLIDSEMSRPMRFICGLPNVKQVIGERILDVYGCVKHALDAVDKWEEIDGIGKVKLAKIKDTLMEGEYK